MTETTEKNLPLIAKRLIDTFHLCLYTPSFNLSHRSNNDSNDNDGDRLIKKIRLEQSHDNIELSLSGNNYHNGRNNHNHINDRNNHNYDHDYNINSERKNPTHDYISLIDN